MLLLSSITLIASAWASVGLAGPLPVARTDSHVIEAININPEQSPAGLLSRSGNHRAVIYSEAYCGGTQRINVFNFPCGGVCHTFDSAWSILLTQDGTGNPKPTGSIFSDWDCKNKINSVGIYKGEHSGCTSFSGVAHSAYLYFNC